MIYRSLLRAQIPAKKEPTGLCQSDGKRPDGVSLIPWNRGRCVAWDVTVVDTLARLMSQTQQRMQGQLQPRPKPSR